MARPLWLGLLGKELLLYDPAVQVTMPEGIVALWDCRRHVWREFLVPRLRSVIVPYRIVLQRDGYSLQEINARCERAFAGYRRCRIFNRDYERLLRRPDAVRQETGICGSLAGGGYDSGPDYEYMDDYAFGMARSDSNGWFYDDND